MSVLNDLLILNYVRAVPSPSGDTEKKLRHEPKFPVFRSYKSSYSYEENSKILIIQYANAILNIFVRYYVILVFGKIKIQDNASY